MVADSGATPGAGAYQPVNLPEPILVETNAFDRPVAIRMERRQPIINIEDNWRIDDEWWRQETVSRIYYSVRLGSGRRLVIYQDLTDSRWYQQAY